jgi:hypothetical protein
MSKTTSTLDLSEVTSGTPPKQGPKHAVFEENPQKPRKQVKNRCFWR